MTGYLPLYAEKLCAICGFWRGQHTGGSGERDDEMQCPSTFTAKGSEA